MTAAATAAAASTAASTNGTTTTPNALAQLGANFNQFLRLLLTQVQNQDPTSPTDTNQFTTELVQFTGVQEQVNTNANLSQLIKLQQAGQVLDSANLVGRQATVTADQITLQNGTGELSFTGKAGQQIGVTILDATGAPVRTAAITATAGTNLWQWDGKDANGTQLPDGAYHVSVQTPATNGTLTPVPFSIIGTATGVSTTGTSTQLHLGALSVDLSALQSVEAK